MPNRKKAPKINEISSLVLPPFTRHLLDNGAPVYEIHGGSQDVLKVEIAFNAGRPFEHKPLTARATSRLLKEGSRQHSAKQLAEQLEFYAGTINLPVSLDTSNVLLYSLSKHFEKVLPVLTEIVCQPVFPERELQSFVARNKQRLQVDLAKTDVVAYRMITEQMFGSQHPYGYNSMPATYDALTRADIELHYNTHFTAGNCYIFLSGKTSPYHIDLLNNSLGQHIPVGMPSHPVLAGSPAQPSRSWVSHPEAVQTAIRIGRKLFDRKHADYFGMYVLNTILGGYFGSRLMTNIREEKGYTYNIFSSLDIMHYDGCFYIGTEVGNEFVKDTLTQIYKECRLLQEELVDEEELEMVRNYLLGNFLTMLDGAFNVADIVKSVILENLPEDHFERMVQHIRHITAEDIRTLAQKYLDVEEMWEVVVGVDAHPTVSKPGKM